MVSDANSSFRDALPQLGDGLFLTDSGLETDMIFNGGFDLPEFASFVLLEDEDGIAALQAYFRDHAEIAREAGAGFIFESATWRASPDWGSKLGYGYGRLDDVNTRAVELLVDLRDEFAGDGLARVISGAVGPRGDGYRPDELMSADEAQSYHSSQIETFARSAADMVNAMTMTHTGEAIGIVRAADAAGIPVAISFTVETDGRLPDGTPLGAAIAATDEATGGAAAYFAINCAHPTHFAGELAGDAEWIERLRGIRANASRMSHAELDEAEELDDGDPAELGSQYAALRKQFPKLNVLGGCCGTDARHVRQIALACAAS